MTYMTWEVYECNQDNTSILLLSFALSGEVLFEEGKCLCDYRTRGEMMQTLSGRNSFLI